MKTALTLALVCAALIGASAQQAPPRDTAKPAPPPAGSGALAGVVTNDDGSRAVRNAYVVVIGTTTGVVKVTSTDADGRFNVAGLAADRYTVGVSKPPYLGTVAGARRPGRPGTPIAVADGQKVTNVAVRMAAGAAIAGTVLDERGTPARDLPVTAHQWRMQNGVRTLVQAGSGFTDDRGRYRIFGLVPGEYIIATRGMAPAARALTPAEVDSALKGKLLPPPPDGNLRYAPVYFPGTTREDQAIGVSLASGEERQGVDLRLQMVPVVNVEGIVVTADGQPVPNATVSYRNSGTSEVTGGGGVARARPDGRFQITGVAPGSYLALSFGALGGKSTGFGMATVDVAGTDVLGVQIVMQPALSIPGRLMFRGSAGATLDAAGRRLGIRPVATTAGAPTPSISMTDQSGVFTVSNLVPGRFVITGPTGYGPTSDSMTWTLESVLADGQDVTDLPLDVSPDKLPKELVVTIGDRFQELSGRLTRTGGAPVSDHTIIVFPEDKAYWYTGSRRIVITRPGSDGRFSLSGQGPTTLPPGKYLLAAVTDIDRDEQFDPAFLAAVAKAAVPITLQPGEKKVQDLVIR